MVAALLASGTQAAPPLVDEIRPDQVVGFLNSKVQRQDKKVIGRTINVIIENGAPRRAIIDLDGFMGVGHHTAIVPWDALQFDPAGDPAKVMIDLTLEQLRALAKAKPSPALATSASAQAEPPEQDQGLKLIDAALKGTDDREFGKITDVLVDRAAQPRAVIAALGEGLDPKFRQIAVSWRAIHFGSVNGKSTVFADVTRDQSTNAGVYESDKPAAAILPQPASAEQQDGRPAATAQ